MSFRNTFITSYIYCASDEVLDCNPQVKKVFDDFAYRLDYVVRDDGYGYYAGFFKTLDPHIPTEDIDTLLRELGKVTKVPFKLTIMLEADPVLIYDVIPEDPIMKTVREEERKLNESK